MIEFIKKGAAAPTFEQARGRIVLVDANQLWPAYRGAAVVVEDAGRYLMCAPLARQWNQKARRYDYFDAHGDDRHAFERIDRRSVRVLCDHAAEVEALIAVEDAATAAFLKLKDDAAASYAALAGSAMVSKREAPAKDDPRYI